MQTLKFISAVHKLNYLSPLSIVADPLDSAQSLYRYNDNSLLESTDNSSSSSPSNQQDFSDWYRRSSPTMDRSTSHDEEEDDDENDEVLSVGCESPPPPTTENNLKTTKKCADSQQALKFSIDNILRPEFGEKNKPNPKRNSTRSGRTTKSSRSEDSPVDLSKECFESSKSNSKTESSSSSSTSGDGNTMWPAWVYCTRYSDRPSSGEIFCF